jgi:16S rRNA (guanine966-N2)-methyltransferase
VNGTRFFLFANIGVCQKNKQLLKADNLTIFRQDAFEFLKKKPKKPFDLILLDPPFNKNYLTKALKVISKNDFVAASGYYAQENAKHLCLFLHVRLVLHHEKVPQNSRHHCQKTSLKRFFPASQIVTN